ncbi:MAG: hypothetical protein HY782_15875 [Chloroflexi bacterium]|nr:hypothetical protein [Chloroflexota bacterium]
MQGRNDWLAVFCASLIWTPIIFTPLHLFTQGYFTAIGNIVATWLSQIPVNLVAIAVSARMNRPVENLKQI